MAWLDLCSGADLASEEDKINTVPLACYPEHPSHHTALQPPHLLLPLPQPLCWCPEILPPAFDITAGLIKGWQPASIQEAELSWLHCFQRGIGKKKKHTGK